MNNWGSSCWPISTSNWANNCTITILEFIAHWQDCVHLLIMEVPSLMCLSWPIRDSLIRPICYKILLLLKIHMYQYSLQRKMFIKINFSLDNALSPMLDSIEVYPSPMLVWTHVSIHFQSKLFQKKKSYWEMLLTLILFLSTRVRQYQYGLVDLLYWNCLKSTCSSRQQRILTTIKLLQRKTSKKYNNMSYSMSMNRPQVNF